MKKLRSELEDTRLTKTLIFKNIPFQQQQRKYSWNKSKEILAKEIIKVLLGFQVSGITKEVERATDQKDLNFQKYRLS